MWNKAEVGAVNSINLKRQNPPIVPHDGVDGLCNTVAKRELPSLKGILYKLVRVLLGRCCFFRIALLGGFNVFLIPFKLRFFI